MKRVEIEFLMDDAQYEWLQGELDKVKDQMTITTVEELLTDFIYDGPTPSQLREYFWNIGVDYE